MNQQQVIDWLKRHDYEQDKWGYWIKKSQPDYRFKLTNVALAYQKHIDVGDHKEWQRLYSAYLKNLLLTEKDKLVGLSRAGC